MADLNLRKAMSECSRGDRKAMDVLRRTSLADTPDGEFAELVVAVNKAGGVAATRGLPRVLIAAAVRKFNDGVAKGDYVGHPFRGNQYSDASGASRGGAGGSPKGGKGGGGRRVDAGTGGAKRRASGRYSASEERLQALNDELAGRKSKDREAAEQMAQSMLDGSADITFGDLEDAAIGIKALRAQAEKYSAEAEYKIYQANETGEPEEYEEVIDKANDDIKTFKRLVGYGDKTTKAIAEATRLVEAAQKGISNAANLAAAQAKAIPRIKMARDALLKMDSELKKMGETHRQMSRSGFGNAHSTASSQIIFMRDGLRQSLGSLEDFRRDVDGSPDAAQAVLETMGDDD